MPVRSFEESSALQHNGSIGGKDQRNGYSALGIIFQRGAPIFTRLPANDSFLPAILHNAYYNRENFITSITGNGNCCMFSYFHAKNELGK